MDIGRYIAQDRLHALAAGRELADRSVGSVLFADIVGFTALGERYTSRLGEMRGIEAFVQRIDQVYESLIVEVERRVGVVVGFAGDALTCWFDMHEGLPPPAQRAVACAHALQSTMSALSVAHEILQVKVAVASGSVRRFAPGNPQVQRLDTLAGATVSRLARAEQFAQPGDIVLDRATVEALDAASIPSPRRALAADRSFAVLEHAALSDAAATSSPAQLPAVPAELLRPWLLAAVFKRELGGHGAFLTELRPTVSLFVRFEGIEYDADAEAGAKLDQVVQCIQMAVEAQKGAVLQLTIGDKGSYAYACFGAPIAHEDDGLRAASAAHKVMQGLGEMRFLAPVRIGLSAGTARVGAYGGRKRATYGALGDDVNLAARLMTLADPGQILLTEVLRRPVAPQFVLRALPPVRVKGHAEPIGVHALLGPRTAPASQRARERRFGLAMVGRQRELALIERKLVLAAEGQTQVVGITGDPGVGKSRLVAVSAQFAQRHGFVTCTGLCEAAGQGTPYLVWRPIWRSLLGIDPDADDAIRTELLRGLLGALAPQRLDALPTLAPLLGVQIEDNEFTRPLAPQDRANVLSALLEDCVRSATAKQPLLFVLEDVQWIDQLSLKLLEDLARVDANLALAFMLAYRPSHDESQTQPQVERLPGFARIELDVLEPGDVAQLVDNKLAQWEPGCSRELASALATRLNARAEGNPFYIEELLNYLQQRHIELTQAVVESDDAPIALPASLNALILSRIDLLSESQRVTLLAASVIGRQFRVDWLHGCYPGLGAMHSVQTDLAELHRLDLTAFDPAEPEAVHLFKHVLTREVAYESLPVATRQQMHGQLAAHLESIDPQRHVDLLAHHYSLGANVAKQREYLERAAVAAQRAYANEAAIGYYSRLIVLIDSVHQLTALLRARAQLLVHVGRWNDAQADYTRALGLAEQGGDAHALATVEEELGTLARLRGDSSAALRRWQRALAANEAAGARRDCGRIHGEIAQLHAFAGRSADALAHMREALRIARETGDLLVENQMLMLGSWLDPDLGDYDTVRARMLELAQALRERGDKSQLLAALNGLGLLECEYGHYARARAVHEQGLELASALGAVWMHVRHLANLARACCCDGDFAAARTAIDQTIAPMRELGWSLGLPVALVRLAEIALLQGEFQVAREALREALPLQREDPAELAHGLHCLGHLMLAEGDLPQAHRAFCETMEVAAGAGVRNTLSSSTLVGFAGVATRCGALLDAVRLAAAVRPLDATHRRPLYGYVEQWLVEVEAACRDGLSAAECAQAASEGAGFTLDDALTLAFSLGERIGVPASAWRSPV